MMRPLTRTGALAICLSVAAADHEVFAQAKIVPPVATVAPVAPTNPPVQTAPTTSLPWQTWAQSSEGRPIELLRIGAGSHQVLVIAGLAGDDTLSVELGERLIAHLNEFPSLVAATTVTFVRDANPDGRARRTAANAHGVLLEHNFAASNWRKLHEQNIYTSGRLPESEPETKALTELVAQIRPERVLVLSTVVKTPQMVYAGSRADWMLKSAHEAQLPLVVPDLVKHSGSIVVLLGQDRAIPCVSVSLPRTKEIVTLWPRVRAGLASAVSHGFEKTVVPVVKNDPPPYSPLRPAPPVKVKQAIVTPLPAPSVPVLTVLPDSSTVVVSRPELQATPARVVATPAVAGEGSGGQPRHNHSFLLRDAREVIPNGSTSAKPVEAWNGNAPRVLSADELATGGKLVPVTVPSAAMGVDGTSPEQSGSYAIPAFRSPFGRRPQRVEIRSATPATTPPTPDTPPSTSGARPASKLPPAVPVLDERALPQPPIPHAPAIRP
ncbi:MAG: hypothetical protein KF708_20025 [Pirellulales bacterium]|nr:hypothetical protein [Pirellulales bacterium]